MGTDKRLAETCRTEVTVDVPIQEVWRIIADPTRTGEWSHECHRVTWLHGATAAAPGARFRGHNRSGRLRWSRVCEIVAVEAPRQITWQTVAAPMFPDVTEWCITLEPVGSRTKIVQTYRMLKSARWFDWIVARVNPTHLDRRGALTDDLHRMAAIAATDAHTVASTE